MDSRRTLHVARRAASILGWLGLLGLVALAAAAAYAWRERLEFARLDDAVAHQLDLYAAVLDLELGKQADLPALIDAEGDIAALLRTPADAGLRASVNRRLARFSARTGALSTTLYDGDGNAVAASDWYAAGTRADRGAAAEPCVAEALAGHEARRFSPNPQRGAPEVCLARSLDREGQRLGVVAVRISLEPIEAVWMDSAVRAESEKPLVVDERGDIIVSSVPGWRLQRLAALSLAERTLSNGTQLVLLRDESPDGAWRVVHERPLPRLGWRLLILSSASDIWRDARAAAWTAGAVVASAALLLLVLLQRRRVVAQKLAARAALQRAHDELELKVQQRTAELLQAGKLAVLGQLSASISHELGQPLTALSLLASNGSQLLERGHADQAADNLKLIAALVERMGRITSQLKSFARKAHDVAGPVQLVAAVSAAQRLLAARLDDAGVEVRIDVPGNLHVLCDAHRLEQVLVNLMLNAIDAMRESSTKLLVVDAAVAGARVVVRVADTGPGIAPGVRERLFEPFFTTKPSGEGLGLGLVISADIVREFGGGLRAVEAAAGAVFEFDVALLQEEAHV